MDGGGARKSEQERGEEKKEETSNEVTTEQSVGESQRGGHDSSSELENNEITPCTSEDTFKMFMMDGLNKFLL